MKIKIEETCSKCLGSGKNKDIQQIKHRPMLVNCDVCDGKGVVESSISINDLKKLLKK